jgi:hypothetical protein
MKNLEKVTRITKALKETQELLAKELSYPENLRNKGQVEFYKKHSQKLSEMLNSVFA